MAHFASRLMALSAVSALAVGCFDPGPRTDRGSSSATHYGAIACDEIRLELTTGGGSAYDAYACTPNLSPTGSEATLSFTCPASGDVVVDAKNASRAPVVAILPASGDPDACITGNLYVQRFPCVAGEEYLLVVDHQGPGNEDMTFDLNVTCDAPTVETACDDGWDNDADFRKDCRDADCIDTPACPLCNAAGSIAVGDTFVPGDTGGFGSTDEVDVYSCTESLDPAGREYGYVFTPTVTEDVVFTVSHAARYPIITVIEDKGNGCMGGDCIAGNYYSRRFTAEAGKTYYLMVDSAEGEPFSYLASLVPAEVPETSCADDIDNDGDAVRDCNDPDCAGSVECETSACAPNPSDIDCSTTLLAGDTAGPDASSVMNDYSCLPNLDLGAAEVVYEFRYSGGPQNRDVLVTLSNETSYAAVTVLPIDGGSGACSPGQCLAGNWYSARFNARRNRRYYVVVEGGFQSEVAYDLSVACEGDDLFATEDGSSTSCSDGYDNDGDNQIDCDDADCATACQQGDVCNPAEVVDCGSTLVSGSTAAAAATDAIAGYDCAPNLIAGGAEYTYTFTATQSGWVNFTTSNRTGYATVAVLEDTGTCDPYNCVGAQYYTKVVYVEAGKTYHVVVDGKDPGTIDYDFHVLCDPPVNETACDDGIDNDGDYALDCADPDCAC